METKVLRKLINYIDNKRGDFISDEPNGVFKDHLSILPSVKQLDLDDLCDIAHKYLLKDGENIGWSMGEIIFIPKG